MKSVPRILCAAATALLASASCATSAGGAGATASSDAAAIALFLRVDDPGSAAELMGALGSRGLAAGSRTDGALFAELLAAEDYGQRRALAERAGAQTILYGAVIRDGEHFRADIRLFDVRFVGLKDWQADIEPGARAAWLDQVAEKVARALDDYATLPAPATEP